MNDPLEHVIIVLHRPRDVVNIGGVVRAMKNTGLSRLRLVDPEPFDPGDVTGIAHRGEDVLARTEIFDDLHAALADATLVVGTTARARGNHTIQYDVRTVAGEIRQRGAAGRIALLFGREDNGLDNAALDQCDMIISLPINPAYPSLNLAQAVLLVGYELWTATSRPVAAPSEPLATHGMIDALFDETERSLAAIEFFKNNATQTMRSLRQIAQRAALTGREVALLTAIAREVRNFLVRHVQSPPNSNHDRES